MTPKTKEILTSILRAKFDSYNTYWRYDDARELMDAVKDAGFSELANEMKTDL